jgi:hypothetical protein
MTGSGRSRPNDGGAARRLTLTPISFDIVVALGQQPDGFRLSPLAQAIGSPVSSVQAALRILVATRLAERVEAAPPYYRLNRSNPAYAHLLGLAMVQPDPGHVAGILLRANPAVAFAAVDARGFVAGLVPGMVADPESDRDRLLRALDTIRESRDNVPPIELFEQDELARHLTVSVGLRDRIRSAIVLKGRIPKTQGVPASRPAAGVRQLVR